MFVSSYVTAPICLAYGDLITILSGDVVHVFIFIFTFVLEFGKIVSVFLAVVMVSILHFRKMLKLGFLCLLP